MDRDQLLAAWRAEEGDQPLGWDFADLDSRMTEDDVPWDLDALYREALATSTRVLDMGTGAGEHLIRFRTDLPEDTVATEGWPPNVELARAALGPLGIQVAEHDPDSGRPMPFTDGRFDLVLNRHEALSLEEIHRVLTPGGTLLSQQVGGDELGELHDLLGHRPPSPDISYASFRAAATAAGLRVVDGSEHVGCYRFADVAALVAYLRRVPWDVPEDFSVDRYAEQLMPLHAAGPGRGDPVRLTRKRFWVKAVRPQEQT